MDAIRVLQIGMHDKIGGVETFLMNYYRNIDKNRVQFDFINMFDKLYYDNEIKELGGKVYNVQNVKKNPISYYKAIKKIVQEKQYNIVHVNMLSMANILPIIAAKKGGAKHIIIHSHNTGTPKGILRKILDKLNKSIAIKNATNYFACSNLAGKWMFSGKVKFEVVNNAIDIENFEFNADIREKIRKELNVKDEVIIGHVGRFCEQKNHMFLINMFEQFCKIDEKSKLLLIGEGELKEKIILEIQKRKLEDRVIILTPKDDIQNYYQAMDVFVLPSKFEGLGIVVVEAQANGLQCICSDAIPDEVKLLKTFRKIPFNYSEWIMELKNIQYRAGKEESKNALQRNNYDIKIEAKKLMNKYIEYTEDMR